MRMGRLVWGVMVLILGGCSANSMIVRNYDGGALPAQQVAQVVVPEEITLEMIDGKEQKKFLLDNLALTYELLPGTHSLVYRYSEIWAKPPGSTDESKVDVVESGLRELAFDFKAGEHYELTFDRPADRIAAKAAANHFSARLVTTDGKVKVADANYVPVTPVVSESAGVAAATVGASAAVVTTSAAAAPAVVSAPSTSGLSRLEALKTLWGETSAEDKKAFLQWAFK